MAIKREHSEEARGHAGCREARKKLADACGPPLEPAYVFAAGADAGRIAATRPACILTYIHGKLGKDAIVYTYLKCKVVVVAHGHS